MLHFDSNLAGDNNDIFVLKVSGDADNHSSQSFMRCIEAMIDNGERRIVLDCSEVNYMSSTGLVALVNANSRLRDSGGSVALVRVPGLFADVIEITRLDKLICTFDSVESAVEALENCPADKPARGEVCCAL